jgi:putative hydrolase of the HAD superfamily
MGVLKPDQEAFQYVLQATGISPERILFLDDNQLNVDGAISAGLQAYRTQGVVEARYQLEELGLIERAPKPRDVAVNR